MYLLLTIIPLLGTLLSGLFGRFLGGSWSGSVATISVLSTFTLTVFAFWQLFSTQEASLVVVSLPAWIELEGSAISWGLLIDSLTIPMLFVVTLISLFVHGYSLEYISQDPHLPRFMSYLAFFTFFMLVLVTAPNLLQMFVGWEGVGLCSFLLINFWFGRVQANKSAMKAMLLNRVGDMGLSLGLFALFSVFRTLDYGTLFGLTPTAFQMSATGQWVSDVSGMVGLSMFDFVAICIMVGAIGKSAQLGLHTWLPDAIEGPTPVSALIHAATIVTAGVFLICRCSPLLEFSEFIGEALTGLGAMTCIFAATTGLMQHDIKRVIAYSTCSQLGYMVFATGLHGYALSMFHLFTHAIFKALLFMGAGSVIHALNDEQDMRKMGGLVRALPLTYSAILVGSLALLGFPFLSGFYSKEAILEASFASYSVIGRFAHLLGSLAAFLTAFYSVRLLSLVFLGDVESANPADANVPRGSRVVYEGVHEAPFKIGVPLVLLSVASVFTGYLSRDLFIGLGTDYWGQALFVRASNSDALIAMEFMETSMKLVPLGLSLVGCVSAFGLYTFSKGNQLLSNLKVSSIGLVLYTFLNRKWMFDRVYTTFVALPTLEFAYRTSYQDIDRGIFENSGAHGFSSILETVRDRMRLREDFVFTGVFLSVSCLALLFIF